MEEYNNIFDRMMDDDTGNNNEVAFTINEITQSLEDIKNDFPGINV